MIDLIGKKYYFFVLSGLLILAGLVGLLVNGIKLDIQFQGGTRITMQMPNNDYDPNKAVDLVQKTIGKTATVLKSQTYNANSSANKLNIMVLDIASKDTLDQDQRSKLLTALRSEFKVADKAETSVNSIAPFIGEEIKTKAIYAVIWASLIIILYVWWRFKIMSGLSAGVMAIVAMLHDILIMCSVYFIFKIPLNDSFIAAVLTVIGYSMNDTIIIYDRIRENSNLLRKVPIGELVNKSVVQTLNRSINTVVTVLICIVTLYIFASLPSNNITSVKEFTFPLIIGISSGMYSSIFIASSLYVVWKERTAKKKISSKPARA
jgi:preprotein translocase subunit SecF